MRQIVLLCLSSICLCGCGIPKIRYEGMDLHESQEVVTFVAYDTNQPEDFTELPGSLVLKISSETPIFVFARENDFWVQDDLRICGNDITIPAWPRVDTPDYNTDPIVGSRYQYSYLFDYKYDETTDYFRPPDTEHDQKVFNLMKKPQHLCFQLRFARYISFIPRRTKLIEFEIPPDVLDRVRDYDRNHPPDPEKKVYELDLAH
ncbi:MAG: hypothetical protein KA099_03935 [Alphaproteobacteria bacterium]|nr:hypothetical protein [Alphaproteobacteria bacterium]MBP7759634.1 hypothetical protein [Alphaproteobacteria bacterium]MBP7762984.1 hypothetical protein [Alphaproteobacteria bacterium]MBP7904457.1 hypothetical protein [Alphaproteobacteria bacterium]